jgi:glycosyltransferase involved in cell wall biosynthesis
VNKRKILVFAHVPPPHHGQSVMVQILLEGLRADPRFEVHHVDARVSDDMGDIGSFRPQKFLRLFKCIAQAWWIRLRFGRMAFYYVPAPAKRSAIMRDWVVMALCRPVFPELILHWHAYGLGEWVAAGIDGQRKLTRWVLGRADLSIVLNNYNKRDAAVFAPKRIEVVPNGIADQFPDYETALAPKRQARADQLRRLAAQPKASENEHMDILQNVHVTAGGGGAALEVVRFLFLGHLIESKGVFVAIEATRMANEELRRRNAGCRAHLTLAGSFASEEEKARVLVAIKTANKVTGDENRNEVEIAPQPRSNLITSGEEPSSAGRLRVGEQGGAMIELVGFLDSGQKKSALERADCLVFPTFYENEAQPLVLLEAMSAGLSVITTSWRGVPEVLPGGYPSPAAPRSPADCADRMLRIAEHCRSVDLRRQFTDGFTVGIHISMLTSALYSRLPQ